MPLIYAFVAREHTVLAEYTSYSGNFATIAAQVCESGPFARHLREGPLGKSQSSPVNR